MNIFETIEQKRSSFTNTDIIIYDRCTKFPESIANESISELTEIIGVSKAALTRFAKKLDFSGFSEFQYMFRLELNSAKEIQKLPRSLRYAQILQNVENAIDTEEIRKLAQRLKKAEHVLFTGRYLSRIPAYYLDAASKIFKTVESNYVHSDELSSAFDSKTAIVFFSVSDGGTYSYILNKYANKADAPWCVLITLSANHPLRSLFDQVIVLPSISSPQYFGTTLPETLSFLMFSDILIQHLSDKEKPV